MSKRIKKKIEMEPEKTNISPIDVIVPIYWINWNYFSTNIQSWYKELPINRLIIGFNNPDEDLFNTFKEYVSSYPNVVFIDQRQFKTLGMCLRELMENVNTQWFAFLHADVELTENSYLIMEKNTHLDDVGIIESDRLLFDGRSHDFGNKHAYHGTFFRDRSYSGFQLFRTCLLDDLLEKIEDDFIYRNEDFIFQNNCTKLGYIYKKTMALHIHQSLNTQWTFDKTKTMEMQFKGLIKYSEPTPITINACISSLLEYVRYYGDMGYIDELESFIESNNPKWYKSIMKGLLFRHLGWG